MAADWKQNAPPKGSPGYSSWMWQNDPTRGLSEGPGMTGFGEYIAGTPGLKPTAPPVGEPTVGTPPVEPGAGGGAGLPAAGVTIPEPTAPALSGYGSAGNAPQMGASAGVQQIAGPDAANPSLGRRIYPQGIRQLAALSPRIY